MTEEVPSRRRRRRRGKPAAGPDSEGPNIWERATEVTLAAAVIFAVMALGSVQTWALFVLGTICIVSSLCAARAEPDARIQPAAWICVALAGWSALQAIPMPVAFLELIAPINADVWLRSLDAAGAPAPTWASVSLDPGASWREALRWSSYACVVFSTGVVVHRRGQSWGATLIFAAGVVLAAVTVMHGIFGMTSVWGIYDPKFDVKPWHVGPLLNPNNLAGYLNLSFLAGLGLAMSPRANRRDVIVLGLVVVASVALLSASRGGVALLVVGVVVLALMVLRWRRTRRPKRVLGVMTGALAGGVLLALLGSSAGAWSELLDGSMEKLGMADWLSPMLAEHPWVGIGRGAFESVSPAHQPLPGRHVRFTHAEVFPLHWAIEWGAVVAALALLAFAFLLRPSRLRGKATTASVGLYVGILVVLVQNLFDLALEVPGVMVAMAAAFGTIDTVATKPKRRRRRRVRKRDVPRPVTLAAAGALLLAVVLGRNDLLADREGLRASAKAIVNADVPLGGFPDALRAAISRHPAEPYFPLLGALVAFHQEQQPVMPFIQRALERGMNDGRIHLLLAHLLARRGAAMQALMELRFAVERDPLLRNEAAALATNLTREPAILARTVPEGDAGITMLEALATKLHGERDARAAILDQQILRRDPDAIEARVRVAIARASDLQSGGDCATEPEPCVSEVEAHAAKLDEVTTRTSAAARVRAELLEAQGQTNEAAKLLVDRCELVTDRQRCWRAAVLKASSASDPELLSTASERLLAESCAQRSRCARTAEWLGGVHAGKGHWGAAMMYYQRAMSEESTADRMLAYAQAAKRAGAKKKARRALERAMSLHTDRKDEIRERLEKLR